MERQRPNPDELLADFEAEKARAVRGRLKIFFGASAGVGKTYAMLAAAHSQLQTGLDVVVGILETHGRRETAALLVGLEQLPPLVLTVQGTAVSEFNLDAALARRPALLLVDELAHTNAPGTRHPKRWQDIEELLAAGIDVFTTLNVQHLESLNDVVGGITGIRVWETVPDTFFDSADEVILVDVPADELLARLKAGKVYLAGQIERAAAHFFRKGNLMALRELALRRTADRVEEDVQAYRTNRAISNVWKTEASLLCCIGPDAGGDHVVRSAARLAQQLGIDWMAVYVETPKLQRLSSNKRERILRSVKLAQDLGAKVAVLSGENVAALIIDYARSHNCSRLVIGRSHGKRRSLLGTGIAQRLGALAPEVDLVEIGRGTGSKTLPVGPKVGQPVTDPLRGAKLVAYVWALLACLATTLVATPLLTYLDPANIVMIFLLTVVLVAVKFGRGPAVLTAFVSVASFDFFFVAPRFSFAVNDVQYVVTFAVMLAVGLITGQMTANLRYQARVASYREDRAHGLYEFARTMSSLLQTEQVVEAATNFIGGTFRAQVAVLLPDAHDRLEVRSPSVKMSDTDVAASQWAYDNSQQAGAGTDTLPDSQYLFLPLRAPMRTRGVLAVKAGNRRMLMVPEQQRHLDTFAALIAIALERVHYVDVAQNALLRMESERLRNSLLAALSHDLRTPLAGLLGLAESLELLKPELSRQHLEIADAIVEEARRMIALVNNLLDMARIESGNVKLNLQWQPIEEVIGTSLRAVRVLLGQRPVDVDLPADLPLVHVDATLIERVLFNLIENAAKYTHPSASLLIRGRVTEHDLLVSVADDGPGLAEGQEELIFDKFTRGSRESATPGVGLGLAISRAIVEAHGGRIWAENRLGGGARFSFTLPLGTPPGMSSGSEDAAP